MGAGVTEDDRVEMAMRLMRMQKTLKDVIDNILVQAELIHSAGAPGLAFSMHMVRESLAVYSKELNRTVTRIINEGDA